MYSTPNTENQHSCRQREKPTKSHQNTRLDHAQNPRVLAMIEVYPGPKWRLETSSKAHIGGKGVCKVTGITSAAISALYIGSSLERVACSS